MQRRAFLKTAAAFTAATQAAPVLGAGERVNLAVVGVGGRGRGHIEYYSDLAEARIGAVVDVNQAAQERAQALVREKQGHNPKVYGDMREAFDDAEIDAVTIATPNHWHALSTIWACQAGKDVYVEKPASHDVFEGRQMVSVARKYDRVVQVGSQSRSIGHKRLAMEMLRDGVIGEVYMVRGLCYRRRYSIGSTPEEPVPPGLDWDYFLGPAPWKPYTENRFAYNWHWMWDTGNGDIGNQGVHEMDIARWALDLAPETHPEQAVSTGGKFLWEDDQETPNIQNASFGYGARRIVFDVRNLHTGTESSIPLQKSMVGDLIYGSEGFMALHPQGFEVYIGDDHEKTVEEKPHEERIWDPRPHMANFLAAVKARNPGMLHADIAEGAESAALCHYANASYRLGRLLEVGADGYAERDPAANKILKRVAREKYAIPERV